MAVLDANEDSTLDRYFDLTVAIIERARLDADAPISRTYDPSPKDRRAAIAFLTEIGATFSTEGGNLYGNGRYGQRTRNR